MPKIVYEGKAKIERDLWLAEQLAKGRRETYNLAPDLLSTVCWASDSKKLVWYCWCAQCKEIILELETHRQLPEWLTK